MGAYSAERRREADAYLPAELTVLSNHFGVDPTAITTADLAVDMREATDLILPDGRRIAKRARTPEMIKHKGDIVFRHHLNSPYPTEWEKILSGCADFCLYSIAQNETEIECWWLIDLATIRLADATDWTCCKIPDDIVTKDEGMMVVKLDGFPSYPPLVVATSEPLPKSTDDICERCRRLSFGRSLSATSAVAGGR